MWSFQGAKIRPGELLEGIPQIFLTLGRMLPPDFSKITESKNYFVPDNITPTELLLPLPLGESAKQARQRWWNNTFPQTVAGAALDFVRTIPDLALGLLFVAAVGLGAFAGTLALAIHTATVLGKLLSESVENIDEGVIEAIRATGAGYAQILSFAVLPQVLPDLISFTLYRLETNIRAASVLGLIGAGGIGYLMNTSFRTFQYQEASAIVVVLIALVMLVDTLSSRLRKLVV